MKSFKTICIAACFTMQLVAETESIHMQLLTKLTAPHDVVLTTSQWLAENQDVVNAALGYEPIVGSVKHFHDAVNLLLLSKGLKNVSNFNYVFELPNSGYFIKIAGHANRKHNLNTLYHFLRYPQNPLDAAHYNYSRALTAEDYQQFAQELKEADFDHVLQNDTIVTMSGAPKTFQTISRAINYLSFINAKEKFSLSNVSAPETYLVHIPGRPTELSDRNYIILEKKIDNLQRIQAVSEQQGKDIDTAVKEANLFDYSKENMFVTADDKIAFVDFEQPNNANPQHFTKKASDILTKMCCR